jgi:phage terminase Nu1 subunit (DNA packaging protein)
MKKPPQPPPETPTGGTTEELAHLFDCTPRQIRLYAQDKIVIRRGRGRYDVETSTRNLVIYLRKQAAGRAGIDPETDTAAANRERAMEQTLLARAKRMKIDGQTIDIAKARELWSGIVLAVRQTVLGLPGQISTGIPMLTAHDRKTINQICRDALEEVSLERGHDLSASTQDADANSDDED